jgi:hypothetical protein
MYIGDGQELTFLDKTLNVESSTKAYKETTLDFAYEGPAPDNIFTVEAIGETCLDKNNGKISIDAAVEDNYLVTVNGQEYAFTSNTVIENLEPGNYNFCVTNTEESLEQCYELSIAGGVSLAGKIAVGKENLAKVTITKGSAPFTVVKNGEALFETQLSDFSVSVENGDVLEVKSKSSCQGVLSKTIDLLGEIKAYPNPSKGIFEMFVSSKLENISIEIYNLRSQLIEKRMYKVTNGKLTLDIRNKPNGVYIVKMNTGKPVHLKLIKN